ncbi:hypothetical protein PR003_g26681 [Phytophthora rubi]|uniref:Uncharacterized protein n=1 Tax=Phytophthora rubi TaxID=129364 RepID=A0A6A4C8H4_9STRA|nr:hypothetical protein PR003_g26681 [Phytophthora rubi]
MDTEVLAKLREVVLTRSEVHEDEHIRLPTEQETTVLVAYLNGELELPHAPLFLKATMPLLQRAMIEQFHETHVEVTLTAHVPPQAKLRRNMIHLALFAQLYDANADSTRGRAMIDRMLDDVKLLHFDGVHTLKFVFNSSRIAHVYQGLAFRLNGTSVELDDTDSMPMRGTYRPAQLKRQYSPLGCTCSYTTRRLQGRSRITSPEQQLHVHPNMARQSTRTEGDGAGGHRLSRLSNVSLKPVITAVLRYSRRPRRAVT